MTYVAINAPEPDGEERVKAWVERQKATLLAKVADGPVPVS